MTTPRSFDEHPGPFDEHPGPFDEHPGPFDEHPGTLDDRLARLRDALSLAADRIPDDALAPVRELVDRARTRRSLSSGHTVVGFFGATGSGKSSLFNAVIGAPLARTHVTRPTTTKPLAAIVQPEGAVPLLDWLGVRDRVEPTGVHTAPLILLDLPDFDSVIPEHRAIAEALAGQVDVLVWVVDPQKYADATLHTEFIRPLGGHGAVTAVVLNQIDLLAPADVPAVLESLQGLLAADGLSGARLLAVSARSGAGVEQLRELIAAFARDRAAATARLEADAISVAQRLGGGPEATGATSAAPGSSELARSRQHVIAAASQAAGADTVADAVERATRKRAGQATGWPLTAWLLRLRPDPLRRLRLDPGTRHPRRDDVDDPAAAPTVQLDRTSISASSPVSSATLRHALRGYAELTSSGLNERWRGVIRAQADASIAPLADALDTAIARTPLGVERSWWWPVVAAIQWIALIAAVVGLGWYIVVGQLNRFTLTPITVPDLQGWQIPAVLLAAGVVIGIVLGLTASTAAAASGRARRRAVIARLRAGIEPVVDRIALAPMDAERERAERFRSAIESAARMPPAGGVRTPV